MAMNKDNQIINFSRIKKSCASCNLQELCLPRGLSQKDLDKLELVVKDSRPIDKGKHLFRVDDEFESLYAVRSGSVKSFMVDENGEEQITGFYFPGEILGFEAIDTKKHTCTAIALETTTFCSLPFERLNDICLKIPDLQTQMFRLLSRELTAENKLLMTINRKTAEEKIATFLISLSSRFKTLGYSAHEFNLPMSRQEIGNYLGLTLETVSRLLSRFQTKGLITINRKAIKIENLAALHAVCDKTQLSEQTKHSVA
jgi:CRP/FNR family transcriptional regulator